MVVKLVITPACHAGGRGFESRPSRHLKRPWNSFRGRLTLCGLTAVAATVLAVIAPALAGQPSKRPSDTEKGKSLYERSCAMCHGPLALGDGPAAASLPSGVPSLAGSLDPEGWDALLDVVMSGRGPMPAYAEAMDRRDARRILTYLADLERNPPSDDPEDAAEDTPDAPSPNPAAEAAVP